MNFWAGFKSEFLKLKGSLAFWLIIFCGFFTPTIILTVRLLHHNELNKVYMVKNFWESLWLSSWESMAIFIMPMASILATSLIVQMEYKNNTWKQIHAMPIKLSTIFFSKLLVILGILLLLVIIFTLNTIVAGIIPNLFLIDIPLPLPNKPIFYFFQLIKKEYVSILPITAIQFFISLRYPNFLVSIGIGFLAWVAAIASLSWKFNYFLPYSYPMIEYFSFHEKPKINVPNFEIEWLSLIIFVFITTFSLGHYIQKEDKS